MTRTLFSLLTLVSAGLSPALASEPEEDLLRLHHDQRTAHVLGDESLLSEMFAPELIEVTNGGVRELSRAAARDRFGAYFDAVRFLEWEDVRTPRIDLSNGETWAEVVVEKRVRTIPADTEGRGYDARQFAWVERWGRHEEGWRLHTITSTHRALPDSRPVDPSARVRAFEILRRAREAVGGDRAVAQTAMLRFRGECEGPRGSYIMEVVSARDGRVSFIQRFPSRDPAAVGIDLDGPWEGIEGRATDSHEPSLRSLVTAHEMLLLAISPQARYSDPAALPSEEDGDGEIHVVEFLDLLGTPVEFLYAADSGQPVGFRPTNHIGRGSTDIFTRFRDWRPVDDLVLPHGLTTTQGDEEYRCHVTDSATGWFKDDAFRPKGDSEAK